jgi:hypothetical protein
MAKKQDKANPKTKNEQLTLEQKTDKILQAGKKNGHIDQREIFAEIPETVENAEILDLLYSELADINVEITTTEPTPETFVSDQWQEEEEEEATDTSSVTRLDCICGKSVRYHCLVQKKSWP